MQSCGAMKHKPVHLLTLSHIQNCHLDTEYISELAVLVSWVLKCLMCQLRWPLCILLQGVIRGWNCVKTAQYYTVCLSVQCNALPPQLPSLFKLYTVLSSDLKHSTLSHCLSVYLFIYLFAENLKKGRKWLRWTAGLWGVCSLSARLREGPEACGEKPRQEECRYESAGPAEVLLLAWFHLSLLSEVHREEEVLFFSFLTTCLCFLFRPRWSKRVHAVSSGPRCAYFPTACGESP